MSNTDDLTPGERHLAESKREATMARYHVLRRRRLMTRGAIATAVAGAALGVGLTLGTSGGKPARVVLAAPPPTTATSSTTAPPTTAPTTAPPRTAPPTTVAPSRSTTGEVPVSQAPSTTTSVPSTLTPGPYTDLAANPGYAAARIQWQGSGLGASSFAQFRALPIAIHDLQVGESSDADANSSYQVAIANFKVLIDMPDAMMTPKLSAEWSAASASLDRFFHLANSPFESSGGASCPNSADQTAAQAWSQEPHTNTSGVRVAPLKQAISDLQSVEGCSPYYPAAIADLEGLEGDSAATIAQAYGVPTDGNPQAGPVTVPGYEIFYLNYLFNLDNVTVLSPPYYETVLRALQTYPFPNTGLPSGVTVKAVGPWQYADAGHTAPGYVGSAEVKFASQTPGETIQGIYDVYATQKQARAAFDTASANFKQSPPGGFNVVNLGDGAQGFCAAQADDTSTCWFNLEDVDGIVDASVPVTNATGSTVLKAMFAQVEDAGFQWGKL